EAMEQEGARRGGGRFQAPVQRVEDFMGQQLSTGALPSSSYRLGVKSAALHDLYPPALSDALQAALRRFDRNLRGFASCPEGLLHGVETRTSSPVKVDRLPGEDMQSCSVKG
ncbi:FAD_binding_2 domain-containing protein, partial [Haematococcus lacustris]